MQKRHISELKTKDKHPSFLSDPKRVLLYAALMALGTLFLVLSAAFIYSRAVTPGFVFSLPSIFHANTAIILASSFTLMYASKAANDEQETPYFQAVGATFLLGIAFLVFQVVGWAELYGNDIKLTGPLSGYTYLYLISGLHGLHVLGGLAVMGHSLFKSYRRMTDPVQELLFSVDPARKTGIGLLSTYWHFVDVLWVYLYLFFIVNMLV